jgi:hypothetical protein
LLEGFAKHRCEASRHDILFRPIFQDLRIVVMTVVPGISHSTGPVLHGSGRESGRYQFRENVHCFGEQVPICELLHLRSKENDMPVRADIKRGENRAPYGQPSSTTSMFSDQAILAEYKGETFPFLQQISASNHT